jgi:CheY-like chemotaxis protein
MFRSYAADLVEFGQHRVRKTNPVDGLGWTMRDWKQILNRTQVNNPMENPENAPIGRQPLALVVDDEPVIRMDIADLVADEGFDVVEARTIENAFEFLKCYPSLRLLITDTKTPGSMTGYELAWEVAERWPHICVVVASADARSDDELPPTAIFVAKPMSADVVHEAIEEYCRNCDER